jgi:transcriptional regulator of acetoin/glycerol metabolism
MSIAIEADAALIRAARPYMGSLSRAAGSTRHAVMLAEARVQDVATPIVANCHLELRGPEQFLGGFHDFLCQGVAVHGVDGVVVGSLSVTVQNTAVPPPLRRILQVVGSGIDAELIVGRLRLRVLELPHDAPGARLERLHQDLIQIQATSRLEIDLAALELSRAAASDAEALLESAWALIERFTRLSRLWQILAEPTVVVVDEFEADQLVRDSSELMQTEARIANVMLQVVALPCGRVRGVNETASVLVSRHALALRRAGEHGSVEVSLNESGRVRWTIHSVHGRERSLKYDVRIAE